MEICVEKFFVLVAGLYGAKHFPFQVVRLDKNVNRIHAEISPTHPAPRGSMTK